MRYRIRGTLAVILSSPLLALLPFAGALAADVRASEVLDRNVETRKGEDVGKLEQLVIDLEENRVAYAVMEKGGVLGIGGKLLALPYGELTVKPGADAVRVPRSPEQMKQAREFDRKAWPAFSDPYWAMTSPQPGGAPAPAGGIAMTPGGSVPPESAAAGATTLPLRYVRSDQIIGAELRQGERKAGKVKDLVFDADSGKVTHALVERDGAENRVPLSTIRATSKQGRLALELHGQRRDK
jgi:sporulation protein YlmC with PRC-barrel domain